MPIIKLKQKNSPEFKDSSFKRGVWKNCLTFFGLTFIVISLSFLIYWLFIAQYKPFSFLDILEFFNNFFKQLR